MFDDTHDLGYDITAALEQNAIVDFDAQALDLVLIVQRGIADRRSAQLNRFVRINGPNCVGMPSTECAGNA